MCFSDALAFTPHVVFSGLSVKQLSNAGNAIFSAQCSYLTLLLSLNLSEKEEKEERTRQQNVNKEKIKR